MKPTALVSVVALAVAWHAHAGGSADCLPPDPCQRASRPGEISIAFLGDSGYGAGGASEWGTHAQSEIARRMEELCPRPDLVFFLGDNIYWQGRSGLFGPRFDTVYPRLFDAEGRRVHAALGNHDIRGCELVDRPAFANGQTCADALVRLIREDVKAGAEPPPSAAAIVPEVLEEARGLEARHCPPAFDVAYEQSRLGGTACFATEALRHPTFGYGLRGENPLRYYTVDREGAPSAADGPAPRLRVLMSDSNTLEVSGGQLPLPAPGARPERSDDLQVLWLKNQLLTAPAEAWTFVAMHHPVFTPRGCALKLLGKCVGAHGDPTHLRDQLWPAFGFPTGEAAVPAAPEGARPPDVVFGAHNHFYARTRALGASGDPPQGPGGVRYFVSGGGGAPLYRILSRHPRFVASGSFHHFVYFRLRAREAFFWVIDQHRKIRDSGCFRKGESRDRCITRGTATSDELVCGAEVADGQTCLPPG